MIKPYFDSAYLKEKLQRFQNRATRIISGANYENNSADVLESFGWEPLEKRCKRNKSILMYRTFNNLTPNFHPEPHSLGPMLTQFKSRMSEAKVLSPQHGIGGGGGVGQR